MDYLINETLSVGDARFRERCREELFAKRNDRAMVMVSHNGAMVKKHCDRVLVLRKGRMVELKHIKIRIDAISVYR